MRTVISTGRSLKADADLGFAVPTYVFASSVLGELAAMNLLVPFGRNNASADATLTGAFGLIPFTVSGGRADPTDAILMPRILTIKIGKRL